MSISAAHDPASQNAAPRRHNGVRPPASDAPYYVATGKEIDIFAMCRARGLPVMLKRPTGRSRQPHG